MKKNNKEEYSDFEVILTESFRGALKDELHRAFKENRKSISSTAAASKYKRIKNILLANAAIVLTVLAFVYGFQKTSVSDQALEFLDQTTPIYAEDVTRDIGLTMDAKENQSIAKELIHTSPIQIDAAQLEKLSNSEKLNIGYHYLSNGKSAQTIDVLFGSIQNENSGMKAEKMWLWSLSKIINGETEEAAEYLKKLKEESSYKTKEINQLLKLLNE